MRVFITGISSGIGYELAIFLLKSGHTVWGVSRSENLSEEFTKYLTNKQLIYTVADISNQEGLDKIKRAISDFAFIPDSVILNAAVYQTDLTEGLNIGLIDKSWQVNVLGSLNILDLFIDDFCKLKKGHFVIVSSTSAFKPDNRSVGYPASKAALTMAMRSLRLHYKSKGIKFSTVFFGPVATPMTKGFWANENGEPTRWFVITAKKAGQFLIRVIKEKKDNYYYPWLFTTMFRFINFLPDSWYSTMASVFKK